MRTVKNDTDRGFQYHLLFWDVNISLSWYIAFFAHLLKNYR
jgi:hypothetical protein